MKKKKSSRMVVREIYTPPTVEQLLKSMNKLLHRSKGLVTDEQLKGDIEAVLLRYAEYQALEKGEEEDTVLTTKYARQALKKGVCSTCNSQRQLWIPFTTTCKEFGFEEKKPVCGVCLVSKIAVR